MAATLDTVDWREVDFVDLGCSSGGSIAHCTKRFDAPRGIGIDIDPKKVAKTKRAGFDAILADARLLDLDRQVRFISMLDFLEHLPDLSVVEEIIGAAARSASDFIYIKHPSFEGEGQIEQFGVRQYWWDWHGHTSHIRVADYCSIFERLGLRQYMIRFVERIADSQHPSVVSTESPMDLSGTDASQITIEEFIEFSPPLWRRQDIFIALKSFSVDEWAKITKPSARDLQLMRQPSE
jgi:SAM-dependent methyltransferase